MSLEENLCVTIEELEEMISDILCNKLNYAYCDNCDNNDKVDECDDCHRKYQNWCLSKHTANSLSKKIILTINSEFV